MKGSIYKRGRIWWAAWYESVKEADGQIRRVQRYESSRSERRSDAVNLLNTRVYESRHRKPRDVDQDPAKLTYEECRDAWLRYRETQGEPYRLKRGPLAGQPTFGGRKHLDAYFGGWKAVNIDAEDIEKFQKALKAQGLQNGIDRAVAALRAMLRLAVKNGRLRPEQLPRHFPMVRQPRKEPQPIEAQYFGPLRDALAEPFRTAFVLAYHTGMRSSEIERLRWEHVDLAKQRLYFPGAKTRELRFVPLLANTADLLAARRPGKPGELVFSGFADRTARARAWRHAAVATGVGAWYCRACGSRVEDGKCSEHGLLTERASRYDGPLFRHCRNTAIRNLTNVGVPIPRIMQMTGHKTVPMHLRYNVATEDDLDLIRTKYDAAQPAAAPARVRVLRRK